MKNYLIFEGEDLIIADSILRCRLRLLVHSRIYYTLNNNLISDKDWDAIAKELVKLQAEYPEISNKVDWYDAFADWDGSTGAFLPLDDPWVVMRAAKLLKSKCFSDKDVKTSLEAKCEKPPKKQSTGLLF